MRYHEIVIEAESTLLPRRVLDVNTSGGHAVVYINPSNGDLARMLQACEMHPNWESDVPQAFLRTLGTKKGNLAVWDAVHPDHHEMSAAMARRECLDDVTTGGFIVGAIHPAPVKPRQKPYPYRIGRFDVQLDHGAWLGPTPANNQALRRALLLTDPKP